MTIIHWPRSLLVPRTPRANVTPFSRGGGRTLGGIGRATRTDKGYWRIVLGEIPVHSTAQRRTWHAIQTLLSGRAGLIHVPIWSRESAPYASGAYEPVVLTPHDDDSPFDDDSEYSQGAISIRAAAAAAIGATSIQLEILEAAEDLSGVRFSYQGAAYETGAVTEISGSTWTVPISPSIRAAIPSGADLEFDEPTCICRLVEDTGMDIELSLSGVDYPTVAFEEAVDYWNDLAVA